MFNRAISGIVLVLLLTSLWTLALRIQLARTEPTELVVPDEYEKIQWAIGNATAGDIIRVKEGTYYEHIFIDKTVSLIGENRSTTIIDGNGTGTIITIEGTETISVENVTIRGFTIQNSGSLDSVYPDSGIWLKGIHVSNGVITHNYIKANRVGIFLHKIQGHSIIGNDIIRNHEGIRLWTSPVNVIEGNNLFNNTEYGIYLYDGSFGNTLKNNILTNNSEAVRINDSWDIALSGNDINNNDYGIHLLGGSLYCVIKNNIMTSNSEAIYVYNSDRNTIFSNEINNNYYGIHLVSATHNIMGDNDIAENNNGIFLEDYSDVNVISSNNITGKIRGIYLFNSGYNTVRVNNISKCQEGVSVVELHSRDNNFYHNSFIDNVKQVHVAAFYGNVWDDGYPSGGNYWSDYGERYPDAEEIDGSGIWDTSYVIDGKNEDRYPLMNTYTAEHDIAVTNVTVSQMKAGQGDYFFDIMVTIENMEDDYFTEFNVTTYYNSSVIERKSITKLLEDAPEIQTFRWFVTELAPGNYTIKAIADTIPGEANITNNMYEDGTIQLGDIHDIALTNLTSCYGSTILTQNFTYSVNITVTNEGDFAEAFTLTLYWNSTNVINSTTVSLAIGETKAVQLDWNTMGFQRYINYTLRAYATPVPNETDEADNMFDDPRILMMVYTGDINNDKKVDIKDIGAIAKLFGINYPNPTYDPNMDLDCNGKINIKDIASTAKQFGYVEP